MTYTRNPGTGVVTDSYAYPASSNKLSTVTLGAGGSRAFTYDAMGDVTNEARTGGAYSYTYDSAGRMATFSIGGVLQASYKYDFAGRQVIRALTSPTAVTIHSVFDSDGNRIAEYNEATGALIREYVWLNGEPLAVIEGGVVNYIRTDHIGRPVFATNSAGTKTWTATYLPFGEVRTTTGTPAALRFPGQWFQSESGLHQNWMRDYDPTTGRYLQADPLGLVDGASIFGYVKQNPGRYKDPRGEEVLVVCRPLRPPFRYLPWISEARHCGVFVREKHCDCRGDAQFSLGNDQTSFNTDAATSAADRNALSEGSNVWNDISIYPVMRPPGSSQCEFEYKLIQIGNQYSQGTYELLGPNSNTAARNLITASGGTSQNWGNAIGQFYGTGR